VEGNGGDERRPGPTGSEWRERRAEEINCGGGDSWGVKGKGGEDGHEEVPSLSSHNIASCVLLRFVLARSIPSVGPCGCLPAVSSPAGPRLWSSALWLGFRARALCFVSKAVRQGGNRAFLLRLQCAIGGCWAARAAAGGCYAVSPLVAVEQGWIGGWMEN